MTWNMFSSAWRISMGTWCSFIFWGMMIATSRSRTVMRSRIQPSLASMNGLLILSRTVLSLSRSDSIVQPSKLHVSSTDWTMKLVWSSPASMAPSVSFLYKKYSILGIETTSKSISYSVMYLVLAMQYLFCCISYASMPQMTMLNIMAPAIRIIAVEETNFLNLSNLLTQFLYCLLLCVRVRSALFLADINQPILL